MNNFISVCSVDLRVIWRTGYVHAIIVLFLLFLLILSFVPHVDFISFSDIVSAIILLDEVIAPVLLVGLLLLYERGEGSMIALAATPIRHITYLAAKLAVVATICATGGIFLVALIYDGQLNLLLLAAGLLGIATISALAGILTVAPCDTLYRFILPMMGMITFLSIPGYAVLFGWRHWLLDLHPTAPALALLEGAFTALPPERLIYGIAGTLIWLAIGTPLALSGYKRMQYRAAGG